MEKIYNAQHVNWLSGYMLFGLFAGAVFFLTGVYILIFKPYELLRMGLALGTGLLVLAAMFSLARIRYAVSEEGIRITRPILHTRLFPYREILSIEKIGSAQAAKMAKEIQQRMEGLKGRGRMNEFIRFQVEDMAVLYSYQSGKVQPGYAEGDFVLIKMQREGSEPLALLLTPENPDDFVARVKERIGK